LKKSLLKIVLILLILCIFIVTAEFFYFYTILQLPSQTKSADLIAVFNGASDRIVKGFELANDNIAPLLMISPISKSDLELFDQLYRLNENFEYVYENQARTTFQNALFVSKAMAKNKKTSVFLVTSDYHLPRSYLLLKMLLAGTDKNIFTYAVDSISYGKNPLNWSSGQRKKVFIEMVEFWGSIYEFIDYKIKHKLPEKPLKNNQLISFMRRSIYFFINRFL
jgi:uncharacterized SAM-binding protein YcdF (DUF218 family)